MQVTTEHFGGNVLWANTDNGVPSDEVTEAIQALDISHVRFPAGQAETAFNIAELENGELNAGVVNFLDWAKSAGITVTLIIPTGVFHQDSTVDIFVEKALEEYGETIATFEIGNEYWNKDVGLTETVFAERANEIIEDVVQGIQNAETSYEPEIILQMGNPAGLFSEFSAENRPDLSWLEAIEASNLKIFEALSETTLDAIDAMVYHYFYNDTDVPFLENSAETNFYNERWDVWKEILGDEIDLYVTAWNVQRFNHEVVGIKSTPIIIYQMCNMLSDGVEQAFVWPINFNSANDLAGNLGVDPIVDGNGIVVNNVLGATFDLMSNSLPGTEYRSHGLSAISDHLWTAVFESETKAVVYLSSISDFGFDGLVDLSIFGYEFVSLEGLQIGYDQSTSNGTHWDHNLKQFVASDYILLDLDGDGLADDEYFTNEHDVSAYSEFIVWDEGTAFIDLNLLPYETIELTFVLENVNFIGGTLEADQITGTAGRDELHGFSGNDWLSGFGDNDYIYGNSGNDRLFGNSGNDVIFGGAGTDSLFGGSGDDILIDIDGETFIDGGEGSDFVFSTGGPLELIDSGATAQPATVFDDIVVSSSSDDFIDAGAGNDLVFADGFFNSFGGSDTLIGGTGDDVLSGGLGADTFVFKPGDGTDCIGLLEDEFDTWEGDPNQLTRDFSVLADQISLTNFETIKTWDDVKAHLHQTDYGVMLQAEGTTISIVGVYMTDLTETNFTFGL
ncbi:hypothetical protein L1065_15240 [Nereida sp. MMG024]|nr:hypothetical protein [Nereida sp. MMG025]